MILATRKRIMPNHFTKLLSIFVLGSLTFSMTGQTAYRDQEFSIATENDAYLLQNNDRYYSNGLIVNYRFIPKVGSFFRKNNVDSIKYIVNFEVSHKVFTPIGLHLTDPETFDRPYSGAFVASVSLSRFSRRDRVLSYGLEVGAIGDASGADGFQKWYHRWAGFPDPKGWGFQIRSEPVIALKGEYNRQFVLLPKTIDLVTYSKLNLGTTLLNTGHGFDVRLGKLQPLNHSAFKSSLIGKRSDRFIGHNYFFFGYGVEYVAHNSHIEGSMWNIESPHTEEILNWVRHWRMGWAANSENTTFKMTYYHLSEEVVGAQKHGYIAFELQLRFKPSEKRGN